MLPARNVFCRSSMAALVLGTAASWLAGAPAAADAAHNLHLGNSRVFQFAGNPSTGYRWTLNKASSSGLDLVQLESLGYASVKSKPGLVGAPAPFRFRVTCVKAGAAQLRFDYIGPTGNKSGKRQDLAVRCE
jgi:predicted secreted protein